MNTLKKIGILGIATQNQNSSYGFDVIKGQLCMLTEPYNKDFWRPVTINDKGEIFEINQEEEPLTFERIRKECVAGETLLVNSSNTKYLFCGWDHLERILLQYLKDDGFCPKPQPYHEAEVKHWRIGEKFKRLE